MSNQPTLNPDGREYTPTTDDLREIWVDRQLDHLPSEEGIRRVPETQAAFDRWLNQIKAEAWAEAYTIGVTDTYYKPYGAPTPNPYIEENND